MRRAQEQAAALLRQAEENEVDAEANEQPGCWLFQLPSSLRWLVVEKVVDVLADAKDK